MITAFAFTALIMLIFVLGIWTWYLMTRNPSIVDVCWSIGIFICGSSYLYLQLPKGQVNLRDMMVWLLLLAWAGRLAGFLWVTRIAKGKHDPRYQAISQGWKISKEMGFLLNYALQGFLMLMVALPFLFIPKANSPFEWMLILLIILALIGESIADWQLNAFKKTSHGVCNVGLWQYSRHPNYFFEWVIWLGFALLGVSADHGWFSLLSPLILFIIFFFVTGPITERQSLLSRGDAFKEYQRTTSFIIPWFRSK